MRRVTLVQTETKSLQSRPLRRVAGGLAGFVLVAVAVGLLVSLAPMADAAAMTATSITPGSTVPLAPSSYAFGFTPVAAWPANGLFTATFPTGFDVSAVSSTVTAPPCDGAFVRAISGQNVTVTRSGGTPCSGAIVVNLGNVINPGAGTYTIPFKTRTSAGADIDTSTDKTVTIVPGALLSNVVPSNVVAGTVASYTFTITTTNPWPFNGKMSITFPTGYSFTGLSATAPAIAGNCAFGGSLSATSSLRVVTLTRSGGSTCPAGATATIVLAGVKNAPVSATTGPIVFHTATSLSKPIDAFGRTFADGATTSASATVGSATGFLATDVGRIISGAGIPAGTTITAIGGPPTTATMSAAATATGSGLTLTVEASRSTADGVTNTDTTLSSATMAFTSRDIGRVVTGSGISSGTTIVSITSPTAVVLSQPTVATASGVTITLRPAFVLTPGALTAMAITPTNAAAGATTNQLVQFTTANPLPKDGKIVLNFLAISPGLHDVASVTGTLAAKTGCTSGNFAVSRAGSIVTITRDGTGSDCSAGATSFTLGGIKNPGISGPHVLALNSLMTTNAAGVTIDNNQATVSTTINPGVLSATTLVTSPAASQAGSSPAYQVEFTLANDWAPSVSSAAAFTLVFPSGYDADSAAFSSATPACVGTMSPVGTPAANAVSFTRTVGTCTAGTAVSLVFTGIVNPGFSGPSGTITFCTQVSGTANSCTAARTADTGTGAVTLTAGPITPTSVTATPTPAGSVASYTITFAITNQWPSNGRVAFTFPASADLSGLGSSVASTGSGCATGTFSAARLAQVVTVTRSGGANCPAGTAGIVLTLTGIRNPSVPGAYGLTWTTLTSAGQAIDTTPALGSPPAASQSATITVASITDVAVHSTNLVAGGTGTYSIEFTLTNPWPADGRLQVAFPTGYVLSGITSSVVPSGCTTGTFTASAVGTLATVTRSGGASCAAGTFVKVPLGGVRNNGVSGAQTFSAPSAVKTTTSVAAGPVTIDQGPTSTVTVTLTTGALSSVSVIADSSAAAAETPYEIHFTTANAWPADGKFQVTLPGGYDVEATPTATPTTGPSCTAGSLTNTALTGGGSAPWVLVFSRGGGASSCPAGSSISVRTGATSITNPSSAANSLIAFQTQVSGGTAIDSGSVVFATGPVTPLVIGAADPSPSVSTTYSLLIATTYSWPAAGTFEVTFPTGFVVGTPTSVTMSGCSGSLTAAAPSGQTLTFTRNGAAACPPTTMLVTFNMITNPGIRGRYGPIEANLMSGATLLEQHLGTIFITRPAVEILTPNSMFAGIAGNRSLVLQVKVRDALQNGVAGVAVQWSKTGDGTLYTTSSTTDDSGIATAEVLTSADADSMTVSATAAGLQGSPVQFKINPPGTPPGGCPCVDSLMVTLSRKTVSADVGTVTAKAEGFDENGNTIGDVTATTIFTIEGGTCVDATCTITVSGDHNVTGVFYGRAGSKVITVTAGAPKSLSPGAVPGSGIAPGVSQTVTVTVLDAFGNGVPDVTVMWTVEAGGGSVEPGSGPSGDDGIASATLTTGSTPGANRVEASVAGLSRSVTITIQTATPATITASPSSFPSVQVGASQTISVTIKDAAGKGLAGARVSWSTTRGTLSDQETAADANGVATVTFKNNAVETATVKATTPGLSAAAEISVKTVAGPAASMTMSPTTATVGVGVPQTFTLEVKDAQGNIRVNGGAGAVFSITPEGNCVANTCTAMAPGAHTVTATLNGNIVKTSALTVTGSTSSSSSSGPASPGVPLVFLIGALVAVVALQRRKMA